MLTLDRNSYKHYGHWSDVPRSIWIWPNFTPKEIASKGDGSIIVDIEAMTKLQNLRDLINKPLLILSGYRDPLHNARIGGAPLSEHKKGRAFDVAFKGVIKEDLYKGAKQVGFSGFGHYFDFLHIDCGKPREWKGSI